MHSTNRAEKPNSALNPFEVLIGEWNTQGTHPYVPGKTLHGRATFEWVWGGAFLLWRSEILDDERFPTGIAIFGSDNGTGQIFMLYFDERDVSRKFDVSFENNLLRWQRDATDFSQRMVLIVADDHKTLSSKGEMRRNGGAWEPDLQLTYTRGAGRSPGALRPSPSSSTA